MNYNKILITGDTGRGKTTFAKKLSKKLNIKLKSTDDFFWERKFDISRDRKLSIELIKKEYNNKKWIIEGTTRHLIKPGLEKADLIIYLGYKNIFLQFFVLLKRHSKRKEEKLISLLKLFKHLIFKRYLRKKEKRMLGLVEKYHKKIIYLYSFKEIDEFLNKI